MGEEETELEGGIYGGENFLNNVREITIPERPYSRHIKTLSQAFDFLKLTMVVISGIAHPSPLLAPSHQPGQSAS